MPGIPGPLTVFGILYLNLLLNSGYIVAVHCVPATIVGPRKLRLKAGTGCKDGRACPSRERVGSVQAQTASRTAARPPAGAASNRDSSARSIGLVRWASSPEAPGKKRRGTGLPRSPSTDPRKNRVPWRKCPLPGTPDAWSGPPACPCGVALRGRCEWFTVSLGDKRATYLYCGNGSATPQLEQSPPVRQH
jgi:hypothetical protein